jgi:hypothetical protein
MLEPLAFVSGALRLDSQTFASAVDAPGGLRLALFILLAGGVSSALGQSVALFANRVKPRRFVASLIVGAVIFAATVTLWSAALAVASNFGWNRAANLREIVTVVGLAHAPRLFAFVALVPYFGTAFGAALTLWTVLGLIVAAGTLMNVPPVQAALLLGTAWVMVEAGGRTVGRPLIAANLRIRRWVAGTPLQERS